MLFRLEKLPLICYLFCIEFSQALLMSYERFVILLKSRSRTHHPHTLHHNAKISGGRSDAKSGYSDRQSDAKKL